MVKFEQNFDHAYVTFFSDYAPIGFFIQGFQRISGISPVKRGKGLDGPHSKNYFA